MAATRLGIVTVSLLACAIGGAQTATTVLECAADASLAVDTRQLDGGSARLAMGKNRFVLFRFRPEAAGNWAITKASILIRVREGTAPKTVRAGYWVGPWTEQDTRLGEPRSPVGTQPSQIEPAAGGWIVIPLPPRVVEDTLRSSGRSFLLRPDKEDSGIEFDSRESPLYAPRLVVEGEARR